MKLNKILTICLPWILFLGLINASENKFNLINPGDTLLVSVPTIYADEQSFSALIRDLRLSEELLQNCNSSLIKYDTLILELDTQIVLQKDEIKLLEERAEIYKRQTMIYKWVAILAGAVFLSDQIENIDF